MKSSGTGKTGEIGTVNCDEDKINDRIKEEKNRANWTSAIVRNVQFNSNVCSSWDVEEKARIRANEWARERKRERAREMVERWRESKR